VDTARVGHEGVCNLAPPYLRVPNDGLRLSATLTTSLSTAVGVRQIDEGSSLTKVKQFTYTIEIRHTVTSDFVQFVLCFAETRRAFVTAVMNS